jgi:hypothetical protein
VYEQRVVRNLTAPQLEEALRLISEAGWEVVATERHPHGIYSYSSVWDVIVRRPRPHARPRPMPPMQLRPQARAQPRTESRKEPRKGPRTRPRTRWVP